MTVRELIKELEKIPNQNLPVYMEYDDYGVDYCPRQEPIKEVFRFEGMDGKDKRIVLGGD